MGKKRKLSSIGGPELELAYSSLLKLKESLVYDEEDEEAESNESHQSSVKTQIDAMLSLLGSRLERPQFSSIALQNLEYLNITFTGFLYLKPNAMEHIATTTMIGEEEFWSSTNLYNHLNVLERLIPRTKEASARVWIDAFFFRSSAMLPPEKRMVLSIGHNVPATTVDPSSLATLSRYVDYTAVVASQRASGIFLSAPMLYNLSKLAPSGFFVVEAKLFNLSEDVPRAICEIYACGKFLQKKVVRGALTNGREWIFLLLKFNDNYDGASFQQSDVVRLIISQSNDGLPEVSKSSSDLIASILSHWVQNSFTELQSDDWFADMNAVV